MEEPPSRTWWELDAYLSGGHTPSEVLWYMSWVDDYHAEQQERRRSSLPAGVISPDIDPRQRVFSLFRRICGRE